LSFNLYLQDPRKKSTFRNPSIVQLAKAIGAPPSAVSWKLANFARLTHRCKSGISQVRRMERGRSRSLGEFSRDWEKLAFESERLLSQFTGYTLDPRKKAESFRWITREALVRVRINQGFFRAAVLAATVDDAVSLDYQFPSCFNAKPYRQAW